MKIVRVTYTPKADYVPQNRINIEAVMADLKTRAYDGINYTACLAEDEKTFIHTAFFKSAEDQQLLNNLPAFIRFQTELKMAGFEMAPKQELLSLVGSSAAIFNA
jgi:hypothetical protein